MLRTSAWRNTSNDDVAPVALAPVRKRAAESTTDASSSRPWAKRHRSAAPSTHEVLAHAVADVAHPDLVGALRLWNKMRRRRAPSAALRVDAHWRVLARMVGLTNRVQLRDTQLRALRFMTAHHARAGDADGGAIVAHAMGHGKTIGALLMALVCQRVPLSYGDSDDGDGGDGGRTSQRQVRYTIDAPSPDHRVTARVVTPRGATTLVLCPKTVTRSWCDQLCAHFPTVRALVYGGRTDGWHRVVRHGGTGHARLMRVPARETRTDAAVRHLIDTHEVVVCHYQALTCGDGTRVCVGDDGDDSADDDGARPSRHAIASHAWRTVLLDEAHWARNPDGQLATALRALHADRVWALTGTPVVNGPTDLWSLLRVVRVPRLCALGEFVSDASAPLRAALRRAYVDQIDTTAVGANGAEGISSPSSALVVAFRDDATACTGEKGDDDDHGDDDAALRVRVADARVLATALRHDDAIAPSAPVALGCTLRVDMDTPLRRAYDAVLDAGTCRHTWQTLTRLRVLCAQPSVADATGGAQPSSKTRTLQRLLCRELRAPPLGAGGEGATALPPRKAVVFCHFVGACHALARQLEQLSGGALRCVVATGDDARRRHARATGGGDGAERRADRHAVVRDFARADSPHNVLINTWILAEGINELACAHVCVLYTPHWHHVRAQQAYKRLHRAGQRRNVHVYQLVYTHSVEEHIVHIADRKLLPPTDDAEKRKRHVAQLVFQSKIV